MTILRINDTGAEVAALIEDLIALGFSLQSGSVFTRNVKNALQAFQQANVDRQGRPLDIDGVLGPMTQWAIDGALTRHTIPPEFQRELPILPENGSNRGRAALRIAIEEFLIGAGEVGANNSGRHIEKYANQIANPPINWCAGFVSYCFQASGPMPFNYTLGAQALYKSLKRKGWALTNYGQQPPEAGDVIAWLRVDRQRPEHTKWWGHIGLVYGHEDGYVWTIEGNKGSFPSRVGVFRYKYSELIRSMRDDRYKGMLGIARIPD